jgi:hypothetical protein
MLRFLLIHLILFELFSAIHQLRSLRFPVISSPISDEGYGSKWPGRIFFTLELEDTSSSFQTRCLQIFLSFEAIHDGNRL